MNERLKRFIVMLGGSVVAAAAITVILAPPSPGVGLLTFAVVMIGAIALSYVIGYLDTPWESTAYTTHGPAVESGEMTPAAAHDREEFRWAIRELVGIAIASAFALVLLILFLLQVTALVNERALSVGEIEAWAVLLVLALTLVVLGVWSWRGRKSEPQ